MSGICGWMSQSGHPDASQQHLTPMSAQMTADRDQILLSHDHTGVAVAAASSEGHSDLFHNDSITVIWQGRPSARKTPNTVVSARWIADRYLAIGEDALQELGGNFSLAIADHSNRRLVLAIDPIGIGSMFYSHSPEFGLVFGSRADSVAKHPAVDTDLSKQAIFDYLYFHAVPSPRCIYAQQEKLLPGQCLVFSENMVQKDFYWKLAYQDYGRETQQELEPELHRLLHEGVKNSLGEGETGSFLSGGTDSSTISGVLQEALETNAKTFSIGFNAEGYDETEFARIASKHFNTDHHEYYVTPQDVADAIPSIAAAYDEPFGNASAVPLYFCAVLAKNTGVTTLLAGDGGDEIFGGNTRYAKQQIFERYFNIPECFRKVLIEPILLNFPMGKHIMPIRKLGSYIRQANIGLPKRMESYNFLNRTPLEDILDADFLSSIDPQDPHSINQDAWDQTASNNALHKMLHLDLKTTLADNDLRKVNQMCELAGIEVAYPLLDLDLVDFSATVPPSLKIKDQKLRWFFKHSLRNFLPQATISKSKHGFGLPFGLWIREEPALHDITYESLASLKKRGIIRPDYIDLILTQHRDTDASYFGVMIWVLLMLEQWLQTHGH